MRCVNCMKEFDEKYGLCPHCGHIIGTPAKEPFQLPPGVILAGRYMVGTAVGVGGFGITYRGWDNTLQQMIAIKEYYPSANGIVNRNPGEAKVIVYSGHRETEFLNGKKRFLDEARNMAKFSTHPNIVHVFDFFEENGTAYITMEFLEGISYKDFIRMNGGKININTARDVTLSVLDALKEIHRIGIIHRDISPDNVFICSNSVIKLIDFGAARFSTGEEEKTLSVILKPGYAPPEQYQRKSRQGPWTDIYAVGAMFYRAITGRMPDESVNRMVKDEMPSPSDLDPDIPESLSVAIMRAMAVNQELRFRNADQFRQAIESKKRIRDVQGELNMRRGRRIGIVAAILLVICAAGGVGFHIYHGKMEAEHLTPATITVWYPAEEYDYARSQDQEDERQPERLDAGERLVKGFLDTYGNNVQVKIEAKPAETYERVLREAIAAGSAPTLFDSSCLSETETAGLADLSGVTERLEATEELHNYYFLDNYGSLFPGARRFPLTCEVPVIYRNSGITEDPADTVIGKTEMENLLLFKNGYATDPVSFPMYEKMIPTLAPGDNYLNFIKQKEIDKNKMDAATFDWKVAVAEAMADNPGYYLSDTAQYRTVQTDMRGHYSVMFPGTEMEVPARFTHLWSISDSATEAEKAAAVRLIYYFLSEEDQLILSLEADGGIPLQKKSVEQYLSTNPELADMNRIVPLLKPAVFDQRE